MGCVVNFFGRGWIRRLALLLGHLFLGFQEIWIISCPVVCISLVIHAIQGSILGSAPTSTTACVAASGVMIVFSSVKGYVSVLRLQRPKMFLLVF
jgi:hypothetical protein